MDLVLNNKNVDFSNIKFFYNEQSIQLLANNFNTCTKIEQTIKIENKDDKVCNQKAITEKKELIKHIEKKL